jgi:hypothetical protein
MLHFLYFCFLSWKIVGLKSCWLTLCERVARGLWWIERIFVPNVCLWTSVTVHFRLISVEVVHFTCFWKEWKSNMNVTALVAVISIELLTLHGELEMEKDNNLIWIDFLSIVGCWKQWRWASVIGSQCWIGFLKAWFFEVWSLTTQRKISSLI